MDTTIASPKASSPMAYRIFGAVLAGAGLLLAIASMGPAFADTAPQTAKVAYADLDLSTETGARTLLHRIDVAANSACGAQVHSPLLPREAGYHHECVTGAVNVAAQRIGSPLVIALNNEPRTQAGVSLAAR